MRFNGEAGGPLRPSGRNKPAWRVKSLLATASAAISPMVRSTSPPMIAVSPSMPSQARATRSWLKTGPPSTSGMPRSLAARARLITER